MKTRNIFGTLVIGALLAGCAATTPPTKVEQALFTTTTNYIPKIVIQTNLVVVDQVQFKTNEVGVPLYVTNRVFVEERETNTVQVPQSYTLTPKSSVTSLIQTGGSVVNTFAPGIGSAIASGLILLFGIWGHVRSSQKGAAATTLAQEVETIREYIKTLPSGTKMDDAITTWLKDHQQDEGTVSTILGLLQNAVSNTEAKGAVSDIKTIFDQVVKTS